MKLRIYRNENVVEIKTDGCMTCKYNEHLNPRHATLFIHYIRSDMGYTFGRCRYIQEGAPGCGFEGYIDSIELLYNRVTKTGDQE